MALTIDGCDVALVTRVNSRARRLIVRVDPISGTVVVTAPSQRALTHALAFAESERAWIAGQLARLPRRISLVSGAHVPVRGIDHVIMLVPTRLLGQLPGPERKGPVWIDTRGANTIMVTGTPQHTNRRVIDFLKREARFDLSRRVAHHCAALGLKVPRLVVRDGKSRWGSCARNGPLSFSWRLVMTPPEVLDYVAAHEVAHLVEMNHSRRFHAIIAQLCPHVASSRQWLACHGAGLHRFGARPVP